MDRDGQYQRWSLVAFAEIIELLSEIVYPSPMKGLGGKPRQVADDLRIAAAQLKRKRRSP